MIDAHQHFWSLANPFADWPTSDLEAIHRDFGPADLEPLLAEAGVTGTVLVQAAPAVEETRYILALAERTAHVKAVVGWIDFAAADAIEQMGTLSHNPWLKGLRPMIQSEPEPGWILQTSFEPVFEAMTAVGLRFDALVRQDQISDIAALAARHPDLPIVLDHCGKPAIAESDPAKWQKSITDLAAHPNVHCKVSGLWTEAGEDCTPAAIKPYVDTVRAAFGEERLMWGSDWPVLNLAGSYQAWLDQALALFDDLSSTQRAAVFGGNAARFYGIDHD
ncbi:amidohydrolase family protein [Altererythrobacter sp.]|uniref:amidohydrolase family protein n=1 Tax=Altererythrobacter sp. TaxID=1872480 RepID=UPI003D1098D6